MVMPVHGINLAVAAAFNMSLPNFTASATFKDSFMFDIQLNDTSLFNLSQSLPEHTGVDLDQIAADIEQARQDRIRYDKEMAHWPTWLSDRARTVATPIIWIWNSIHSAVTIGALLVLGHIYTKLNKLTLSLALAPMVESAPILLGATRRPTPTQPPVKDDLVGHVDAKQKISSLYLFAWVLSKLFQKVQR